jgi:tyrosine-specific transport protein
MINKTVGASLLIAGCIIGTGMLGMPVITGAAGFFPACFYFILAWGFMVLTGLLLARVTLSFEAKETNLISMASKLLGKAGTYSTFFLFTALFYALLVAYCIAGGKLVVDCAAIVECDVAFVPATLGLVLCFYIALVLGLRSIDLINRCLMVGLLVAYGSLVYLGLPSMHVKQLEHTDWMTGLSSLPILIIAFGYHNLVPTLAHYLDKDGKKMKRAILIGTLLPLIIYLIWEAVILAIVPFTEKSQWIAAQQAGQMITELFSQSEHLQSVVIAARCFAFFAIATSFLPVAFSFLDFLRDAIGLKDRKKVRATLAMLILLPSLVVALTKPHLFLSALNYAGGVCTVLLFGLLPALMALKKGIGNRLYVTSLAAVSIVVLISTVLHELGVYSS